MDRSRTLARVLTGAALLLLVPAAADAPVLPISEARWLAPEALLDGLTRQPRECLARPRGEAARRSVAIGRAAFRAPLLLGGQAARAGLSCASCHRNGRGNPHFSFPGVSGNPGTADVTSSLMSKRRGDGKANPKPIPDLAAPPATHIASRSQPRALERFIHGLVVEEFDGAEPPPAVLDGLVAYVRAIEPCPGHEPVTLTGKLRDVELAMAAARGAASTGDRATSRLLIGAARSTLGSVDERFRLPGLQAGRRVLTEADQELRNIQQAIETGASATQQFSAWQRRWPARKRQLRAQEARSLFSPAVLRRQLSRGSAAASARFPEG
jgi:hypothetical protein